MRQQKEEERKKFQIFMIINVRIGFQCGHKQDLPFRYEVGVTSDLIVVHDALCFLTSRIVQLSASCLTFNSHYAEFPFKALRC